MKLRTWVLAGVVAAAVAATYVLVVASGGTGSTAAAQVAPADTVPVKRGELSAMVSLDGTLTYRARSDGSPFSAINRAGGIYTELPDVGDRVDCGDVFYRVDDDPVLLLCGSIPAYRDLDEGAKGSDVRQLNRNLHQLGYDVSTLTIENSPGRRGRLSSSSSAIGACTRPERLMSAMRSSFPSRCGSPR